MPTSPARRRPAGAPALAAAAAMLLLVARAARADSPPGPFARGAASVELAGLYLLESWDKNLATDRLVGGAVAAGVAWHDGWAAVVELDIARAVHARSRDAGLVGLSGLLRWRGWHRGSSAVFLEGGVGASTASAPVPPRGTRFNFIAQAGAGVLRSVRPGLALLAAARWVHLSNGGLVAGHGRNPDLQAVGGYLALQWRIGQTRPRTNGSGGAAEGPGTPVPRQPGRTR